MKPYPFFFYKEDNKWYVDLDEWEGDEADLQMVAGADHFLDILSEGDDEVWVQLWTKKFIGADVLTFIRPGDLEGMEMGTGAWYTLKSYRGIPYDLTMWLCDVTKFVFKEFPKEIYFKK